MIGWITLLLACQFAGEAFATVTALPVPGPVCGMAILFGGLLASGHLPDGLRQTADGLLSNLSLLFVPAGAGVMLHFQLLGRDWLPLTVSLVVSTALTIGLTASFMAYFSNQTADDAVGDDVPLRAGDERPKP